jgi:hypothetical protein
MLMPSILLALVRFVAWESCMFSASFRLARVAGFSEDDKASPAERWLAVLALDVVLESSIATFLSLAHANSVMAYWVAALALLVLAQALPRDSRPFPPARRLFLPLLAVAFVPAILGAFRPIQEIDSVNYLHYLIEWMGNHGSLYDFASYYSPFWDISFLPVWTVTGVDLFFPLLALKGVLLVALAAWVLGLELEIPPARLAWIVPSIVLMRHYWLEYSGVATIKNDAAQGAGFLLLALAVVRAARRPLARRDLVLLGLGVAFGTVKFLGVVTAPLAVAAALWLTRKQRPLARALWVAACFLLSTGHTYLHNFIRFGNPVYPLQLNLGPIHLPGEGPDIYYSSILYNLREPRLWRALFLPKEVVSPAGLLFPAILAGALIFCAWRLVRLAVRRRPEPVDWLAFLVITGWFLYFRAPWSASAGRDDLAYILNNLDSIRLVGGVLAASEILLATFLGRWAVPLAAIDGASRLWLIAERVPTELFPVPVVCGVALAAAVAIWLAGRRGLVVAVAALVVACPLLVERNRVLWTTYWNGLKPALAAFRGPSLAVFAMNEASYFAGHVVAAGNPVDPAVRAFLPEELDAMAPGARPRYLAVLVTPGFDWRAAYGARIAGWGYRKQQEIPDGAIFEHAVNP